MRMMSHNDVTFTPQFRMCLWSSQFSVMEVYLNEYFPSISVFCWVILIPKRHLFVKDIGYKSWVHTFTEK